MAERVVNNHVPTHVLVQKQMQDVLRVQRKAYDTLKTSITADKTEMVPLSDYNTVLKMYEDEKRSHADTKRHLQDVEDKLSYAVGEVELLTRQIEREKRQFEQTFGNLKNKAMKETVRNVELENKCNVISHEHEAQSDALAEREEAIATLAQTVRCQRDDFSHKVNELDMQRRQQAYITRVLGRNKSSTAASKKREKGKKDG